MRQRSWIYCVLNLGLCSVITGKNSIGEKAEVLGGGIFQEGTNSPNSGTGDDNGMFEAEERTSWRTSGFPLGQTSSKSSEEELKSNERQDLNTFISSTSSTVAEAVEVGFERSTVEALMAKREKHPPTGSISRGTISGREPQQDLQEGRKWSKKVEQEEKTLLSFLMDGYEKDVRPVRNASQPILIEVGITLTQIFDMDEKNQVLTTTVWLDQEWYDELLTWDPSDFFNMTSIRLPCHKIWLPDIVLYNSADDYTRGYFASRAMVNHDGKIFWPPPTKFRSTCSVDVTYFPFDDQICKLKLGSWTYNGFQVDVTNRTLQVDLSNYIESGEWELLGAELQRNVVYYSCCPEPFPDVTVFLTIRRKTLFYVFNVIIPCILLSFLTLLVFFLPPDSGEKVALGITVLLAFSVFMLAIAEKMPETSESVPLIGIYLTAVMMITSISVVVTVFVLNLHYLGPRVEAVPNWLRYLLPTEDKQFIMRQRHEIATSYPFESESPGRVIGNFTRNKPVLISHHQEQYGRTSTASVTTRLNVPPHPVENSIRVPPAPVPCPSEEESRIENDSTEGHHLRNRNHNHRPNPAPAHHHHPINNLLENTSPSNVTTCGCSDTHSQDDVAKSLRYLLQKQTDNERQQILVSEWRLAAQVVDRILFWVFFIITFVSSGIFLLVLPLYKRSWSGPMPPD